MDLIKLLDVSNPKKIKDTLNVLIENYENFGDEIRVIAQQANTTANNASTTSLTALGKIEENTVMLAQAITEQDTRINQAIESQELRLDTAIAAQDAVVNASATDSTNAKQIAEEALVIIEQADARSEEAALLAEQAEQTASDAVATSELAMNVATEAKSTVDQAVSTGVFGTFVYNTNSIALQRVYATDNVGQENTVEKEYLATPKLVRDAISDLASTTDLALLSEHKAFATLEDYSTSGFFETYNISTISFWRCSKFNTLNIGDKILCFVTRYRTDDQMQLNGLFSCTITSVDEANRIYRVSSEFLNPTNSGPSPSNYIRNIALISDLSTDLADLNQDAEHRLVTDTEKTTWNNKLNSDAISDWAKQPVKPEYSYNEINNKPTIPIKTSELENDGDGQDNIYTKLIVKDENEWIQNENVLPLGALCLDKTNMLLKIGDGINYWNNLPYFSQEKKITFADGTWEEISRAVNNGKAKDWFQIGDEKNITLSSGETLTLVIVDFDHDILSNGGGKAGITIGLKGVLDTTYRMNASNTNSGGWPDSNMCNSTMPTIFNKLPEDLQNVIKEVQKSSRTSYNNTTLVTTSNNVWLFSIAEIDGTTNTNEGTQYEYYKNVENRIKYSSSGNAQRWWTRSPSTASSGNWCDIYTTGSSSSYPATSYSYVSFGFCI